jgi:hypothetical protein
MLLVRYPELAVDPIELQLMEGGIKRIPTKVVKNYQKRGLA